MTSVGFGDIAPLRQEEYVFAIVVMLAGASLFAYVIASGAALIQTLDLSKVAFWNRVKDLLGDAYTPSRKRVGEERDAQGKRKLRPMAGFAALPILREAFQSTIGQPLIWEEDE